MLFILSDSIFNLSDPKQTNDLAIVLGPSDNFDVVRESINNALSQVKISAEQVLPGIITYGSEVDVKFQIGNIMDGVVANLAIKNLEKPNPGDSDIMEAIEVAYDELDTSSRETARKTMWIVLSKNLPDTPAFIDMMVRLKKLQFNALIFMEDHIDDSFMYDIPYQVIKIKSKYSKTDVDVIIDSTKLGEFYRSRYLDIFINIL